MGSQTGPCAHPLTPGVPRCTVARARLQAARKPRRHGGSTVRRSSSEHPVPCESNGSPAGDLVQQPAGPLIVVMGPTAVGKSQVAVRLAKHFETEIITADSRQVFRGMDIGTDTPSPEKREGVPHRLIDVVAPDQPFNVGQYRTLALEEISRLHGAGKIPLVVGGTGLYIRALVRGLCDGPPADWSFRTKLAEEARQHGPGYLHTHLAKVDPELAARVHPHDEVKIIRGLEVFHHEGRPLSAVHQGHQCQQRPFTPVLLGLTQERAALYRRVNERVESQVDRGLVHETQTLLDRGYGRELSSMKGLGYRQISGFLAGDYDHAEAVRLIKRDTRHFAKRQFTWLAKESGIQWFTIEDGKSLDQVCERMAAVIRKFVSGLPPCSLRSGGADPYRWSGLLRA